MSLSESILAGVAQAFDALGDLASTVQIQHRTPRVFNYADQSFSAGTATRTARAYIQRGDAGTLEHGSREDETGLRFICRVTLEGRFNYGDLIDIGKGFQPTRVRESSDFVSVVDVDA